MREFWKFPAAMAPLALALALTPHAFASSFTLQNTNLSGVTNVGTVTVTDTGSGQVTVTIVMNADFSIKLNGGDVAFSGPAGLTAGSVSGLMAASGANTYSGLTFNGFKASQNISQFGTFDFDYTNVKGAPGGVVSADSLTFVITRTGLNASEFTGFVIHFCTASGTNCGPSTGFASNEPLIAVPETATMGLVGSGLVGIAFVARRRIRLATQICPARVGFDGRTTV
jgi:hypothetical protein